MEKYLRQLKEDGSDLAVKIDAKTISTAPWTVYRCQFGCAAYGKSHYCPPKTPTWKETQEMINCFEYAILIRCHEMGLVSPLVSKIARDLFLDGYYKVMGFGSGPCQKCAKCNPERCNFQGQIIPSAEACGIDVFATVRANGYEIQTLMEKGEVQNHYGIILVE